MTAYGDLYLLVWKRGGGGESSVCIAGRSRRNEVSHLAALELSRWPVWEQLRIQVRSSGAMLELAEKIRVDKPQLKLWGP